MEVLVSELFDEIPSSRFVSLQELFNATNTMYRLTRKSPLHLFPKTTSITMNRSSKPHHFCTSRRIANILARTRDWKPLLETSDIPSRLSPEIVRSVIRCHVAIEPRRLVDFFLWSEARIGGLNHLGSYSLLLVSLCNSGSFLTARDVIDRMVKVSESPLDVLDCVVESFREIGTENSRSVVFGMLIDRYRELGLVLEACEVFLGLESVAEFEPDLILCSSLMRDSLKTDNVGMFWKVFNTISETNNEFDEYVYALVIHAHFRSGNVRGAREIFSEMNQNGFTFDVVIYTTMINGFCRAGFLEEAVQMRASMVKKGLSPNKVTNTALVKGYCKAKRLFDAKRVLSEMVESSQNPDPVAYNMVMDGFVKNGKLKEAFDVKGEMVRRGVEVDMLGYGSLLYGICKSGKDMDKAREILDEMITTGNDPDARAYTFLMEGYFRNFDTNSALEVFTEMKRSNIAPSNETYGVIINWLIKLENFERADHLISEMLSSGLKPSLMVCHVIILNYVKKRKYKEAKSVLDRIPPNPDTYISLIIGLCKVNRTEEAKACYAEFLANKWKPKAIIYRAFIRAYISVGETQMAEKCFNAMLACNIRPNHATCKTLIFRHIRDKNIGRALSVFRRVLEFDWGYLARARVYGVVINALSRHGRTEEAMDVFSELSEKGMKPDIRVYNSLIAAFCRKGDLETAFRLRDDMRLKGVSPNVKTLSYIDKL